MDAPQNIMLLMIDQRALRRDRLHLDRDALEELKGSIRENGLRMPIEVFPSPKEPGAEASYSLISGFRRLTAFKELHDETTDPRYSSIPCFVRPMEDHWEAFKAMIEENAVRHDLSPWEQGSAVYYAVKEGKYDNVEQATEFLFPHASRQKRAKIRMISRAVADGKDYFRDPTQLSERQCVRLGSAIDAGFGDLIQAALNDCDNPLPGHRWKLVEPYLQENETLTFSQKPITKKPTRMAEVKPGVMVRRAKTAEGWALHFSGKKLTDQDVEDAYVALKAVFEVG